MIGRRHSTWRAFVSYLRKRKYAGHTDHRCLLSQPFCCRCLLFKIIILISLYIDFLFLILLSTLQESLKSKTFCHPSFQVEFPAVTLVKLSIRFYSRNKKCCIISSFTLLQVFNYAHSLQTHCS